MQSVPITTNIVSSNPTHCEVYLIQNYVIKFVSDLWQVTESFKTEINKYLDVFVIDIGETDSPSTAGLRYLSTLDNQYSNLKALATAPASKF